MPSNTPRHGLPYPVDVDPLHTYDDILKSFAEGVDAALDTRRHTTGLKYSKNIAYYEESSANLAGYVVIQTNLLMNNYMLRIDLRGYTYWAHSNIIDLSITGYAFAADDTFYSIDVNNRGSMNFSDIKLMRRNSDGKLAIALLPDTSGNVWQYPKMIADAYVGHTEASAAELSNWNIGRHANLSAFTVKKTVIQNYWTYPTMINGWTNYGSGYAPIRYRKNNGMVYIQGLVAGGASTIFTLPEGFRPNTGTMIFSTYGAGGAHRTDVAMNGSVTYMTGNNGFHSLSGISFPTER